MSVETYILYANGTGQIVAVFSGTEEDAVATAANNSLPYLKSMSGVNAMLQYVQDGQIVNRPASPVVLTGLTLSHVPVPAVVQINSSFYATNDATVEIDITNPGAYLVSVVAFPYVDAAFEVTA